MMQIRQGETPNHQGAITHILSILSINSYEHFARILYHIFLSNLMTQVKSVNSTQVSFSSLSKSLTMCQKLYELEFSNSKPRILREMYLPIYLFSNLKKLTDFKYLCKENKLMLFDLTLKWIK